MKTVKISIAQLIAILSSPKLYRGCNFVGFDAITVPKLSGGKSNPHQGLAEKVHSNFLGMLFSNKNGSSYGRMVNRRLEGEGKDANFVAGKLPWGTKVGETALIEHKGNHYLQIIYCQRAISLLAKSKEMGIELSSADEQLIELMKKEVVAFETKNGEMSYLLEGKNVDKDDIIGMPISKSNGNQGGLSDDKKVLVRSFKIESLSRVTINGTRYIIED